MCLYLMTCRFATTRGLSRRVLGKITLGEAHLVWEWGVFTSSLIYRSQSALVSTVKQSCHGSCTGHRSPRLAETSRRTGEKYKLWFRTEVGGWKQYIFAFLRYNIHCPEFNCRCLFHPGISSIIPNSRFWAPRLSQGSHIVDYKYSQTCLIP